MLINGDLQIGYTSYLANVIAIWCPWVYFGLSSHFLHCHMMINSHFLIDSHIAGYKIQNLYLDWQLNAINHLKSRHNRNWIGLLFMFCTWWWGCLIGILVTKTSTRSLEFTLRYHLLPWCQLGAEPFIFHRYLTNTAVKKLKKENAQGLGVYNRMNRVVAEPEKNHLFSGSARFA